ncbi:MAG: hypothetical protein DLM54_03030 [Acidimicrobiales bacterium]|nr:MAG: hypothetical protein DLM54_03030 [Acidimicrobiales bacterium]
MRRTGGSTRSRAAAAIATAVGLLLLAGCHYRGTGEVKSETGSGSAYFVFDLSCPTGGTVQDGTIDYVDRAAGVTLVGTASGPPPSPFTPPTCEPNSRGQGIFTGTYVSPSGPGNSGTFYLDVTPSSAGTMSGATFDLHLTGGPNDGYSNSGPVVLGSITPVGGPTS